MLRSSSWRSPPAGRRDIPGRLPQGFRGISRRCWRPVRVVVLVSVLFVRLRNDPSRLHLDLALLQHQGVLPARPVLDGRESEPVGSRGRARGQLHGEEGSDRPTLPSSISRATKDLGSSSIFGPIFRFVWPFLRSKTSSFLAPKNANPFPFNTFLGSFPLFSIFFQFSMHFPHGRDDLQPACRARLQVFSCDNAHRLLRFEPRVKTKTQHEWFVSDARFCGRRGPSVQTRSQEILDPVGVERPGTTLPVGFTPRLRD